MGPIVRILSVALLSLPLLAGSVSAECAWVLWEEKELQLFGKRAGYTKWWTLHTARSSRQECEAVQEKLWQLEASSCDGDKCPGVEKVDKARPAYVGKTFKPDADGFPGSASSRFLCVPDTIDPREPKSK